MGQADKLRAGMPTTLLSQHAFQAVTTMFRQISGIQLSETKQALVAGRLQKLAQARGLHDVDAYVAQLLREGDPQELVKVVDKLTTNETYFFREPQHFDHLRRVLDERHTAAAAGRPVGDFRVWSAASSSGEEAYSIAMVLGEHFGLSGWQVVGTDLSTAMVETARRGLYPLERARLTPLALLKRWCLKGHGDNTGRLMVVPELRQRVRFDCANLTRTLPDIGQFDLVFLRNVLIYFDNPGKADIVRRVLGRLKPTGLLFIGHAESIVQLGLPVVAVAPAVYRHAK
jgi:chemotaxis protein methyltransferase CheR